MRHRLAIVNIMEYNKNIWPDKCNIVRKCNYITMRYLGYSIPISRRARGWRRTTLRKYIIHNRPKLPKEAYVPRRCKDVESE